MFSSIQSIPGLIFARSDVKAKIRPGVEARLALHPLNQNKTAAPSNGDVL